MTVKIDEAKSFKKVGDVHPKFRCPLCKKKLSFWSKIKYSKKLISVCCNNSGLEKDRHHCPLFFPPEYFWRENSDEALHIWRSYTKS